MGGGEEEDDKKEQEAPTLPTDGRINSVNKNPYFR